MSFAPPCGEILSVTCRPTLALRRAGRAARPDDRRQPLCARCGARLADARVTPAPDVARRQRGLICVLYYAAVSLEPAAVHRHLDVLASQFASGSPVRERAWAVGRLLPANLEHWFGPVADQRHRALMQQHARGRAYNAWFGHAGAQPSGELQDVPPIHGRLPLSRRRRPRAPWFAARRPVSSPDSRMMGPCQPTA
jgi:hypothetical protein